MFMKKALAGLVAGIFLLLSLPAQAQLLAVYRFEDVVTADSVASNLTAANVTLSSSSISYQNGTDNGGARIGFNASWATGAFSTGGKYLQYTLSPASGYRLQLSELSFRFGRTSTGPTAVTIQYSLDGFTTAGTTLVSGAAISSELTTALDAVSTTSNLPAATTQTVTIRIWGHNASGTGNLRFNNFRAFGTVTPVGGSPTLTLTPTSRTGFSYTQGSGPSASQSFTVSGTGLTGAPGNITVNAASTDYELSLNNSSFSSSVQVAYSSSTLAATTVYVRLKASLAAGNYNSQTVSLSGGGTSANLSVSGTVNAVASSSGSSQALRLSRDSIVFATTTETGLDSATVKVFNDGSSALSCRVHNFNFYGKKNFWTNDSVFTLNGRDSITLKIYFKPVHNLLHNSELVIRSNNGKGQVAINVRGQGSYSNSYYSSTQNLEGEALRTALNSRLASPYTQRGYNQGRLDMFGVIDDWKQNGREPAHANDNKNECVYTGRTISYSNADLNTGTLNNAPYSMNTEHSWPQSQGADCEPMQSDLHHLFVTDGPTNSARGNKPFDNIPSPTLTYTGGSRANSTHFEPRDAQKGATARAMLYFALRYYNYSVGVGCPSINMSFYSGMESVLMGWHRQYAPSNIDRKRNDDVQSFQQNRNPFVDYPELLDRMSTLAGTASVPVQSGLYYPDSAQFGTVVKGEAVSHQVVVVNYGNQTVQLSNIQYSGSSAVTYTGSSTVSIAPGDKVYLELTHTGNGGNGTGSLSFTSNSAGQTNVSLPVQFTGRATGWNGTANWTNSSNWTASIVPAASEDAIIESGTVTISSVVSVKNVEVRSGSSVVIASGGALVMSGKLTNNGSITVQNGGSLRPGADSSLAGNGSYSVQVNGHSNNVRVNFWSSPVENANLSTVFSSTSAADRYQFNHGGNANSDWQLASGTLTTARGYSIAGGGNVTFNGKVHHGTYSPTSTLPGERYYLIGNPYPSPISATDFLNVNGPAGSGAIGGTIYYWSQTVNANGSNFSNGDYASWAGGTGVAGSGSNAGGTVPNGRMGVAQGFFVKAGSTAGSIQFTNAMRSVNDGQFFRTNGSELRLWLRLHSSDSLFAQTAVVLRDDASPQFDPRYDAPRFGDYAELGLYTLLDSQQLAIQAFSPLQTQLQIPLGYTSRQLRTLALGIDSLDGNWDGIRISLLDKLTGTRQLLQPGGRAQLDGQSTAPVRDRYVLELVRLESGTNVATASQTLSGIRLWQQGRQLGLTGLPEAAELRWYDLQGRLLQRKPVSREHNETTDFAAGVYVLRVLSEGRAWQQKVVIPR